MYVCIWYIPHIHVYECNYVMCIYVVSKSAINNVIWAAEDSRAESRERKAADSETSGHNSRHTRFC